jgi:hypothetical protein
LSSGDAAPFSINRDTSNPGAFTHTINVAETDANASEVVSNQIIVTGAVQSGRTLDHVSTIYARQDIRHRASFRSSWQRAC